MGNLEGLKRMDKKKPRRIYLQGKKEKEKEWKSYLRDSVYQEMNEVDHPGHPICAPEKEHPFR